MPKVEITRRTRFCAAHRLHSPHLSDEENQRVFGPCNNPHGHGHNYVMDVTIAAEPDPETGMVMNLDTLNAIIEREIIAEVDHRNLNVDVPCMNGVLPTVENMCVVFWAILERNLPPGSLKRIHIWETENNSAAYSGPEGG